PVLVFGMVMPFLIGVSRIYLGVHNTGDVLAGWSLGVASALLTERLGLCPKPRSLLKNRDQNF
ncbi:MAG: phosphatase PAP2 family protein, partial [Oscillospiraceae bacterium]|nr:phosphatase PAP2 family protein [Oscillospiraceae bacterium]